MTGVILAGIVVVLAAGRVRPVNGVLAGLCQARQVAHQVPDASRVLAGLRCGELAVRWSRLAALHHGRRARPSLKLRHRLILPATAFAVRLGRGQWGRQALQPQRGRAADRGGEADRQVGHRR